MCADGIPKEQDFYNTEQGGTSQEDIINLGPDGIEPYANNYGNHGYFNDGGSNQYDQYSVTNLNMPQKQFDHSRHHSNHFTAGGGKMHMMSPLVLEDFNSQYIKIKKVPKNAS